MGPAALVVHDEPALRRFLRLRLERAGVRVLDAPGTAGAVELFAAHAGQVRVVVAGRRLAGLSCADLVAGVRRFNPTVPVFLFSARPAEESDPPGVRAFAKPHEMESLLQAVRVAVGPD